MNRYHAIASLVSIVVVSLILVSITACGTPSPTSSQSPSSPVASKASSSPSASSPASPAASPAASKPAADSDQEYQKALADFKQVEEAARKEGEATIYSVVDVDTLQKLQDTFNKIDPKIQVKLIRMIGAQAIERVRAEQAQKQYITNAYYGTMPQMAEEGLLQPIDFPVLHDKSIKWIVDPQMEKPLPFLVASVNKLLLVYNTQMLSEAEAPKTWKEMADPKWKNKFAVWEPRISSYTMDLFGLLYYNPNYGPDWVQKTALNVVVGGDSNDAARSVARGEVPVGLTSPGSFIAVKGAPVKAISPTDGVFASPTDFMIIKNAPQVNVARVFGNWLLGKEAQSIISAGYATIRGDVKGEFEIAQIQPNEKLLPNTPYTAEMQKKMRGEPVQIYKKWMDDAGR